MVVVGGVCLSWAMILKFNSRKAQDLDVSTFRKLKCGKKYGKR
ncbi:hypothetical protein LEP1GSC199_1084 [Leptospira vanthielii serovar Holland str. Waz Holland = ATCC 700522]|uniref:Uncharacterized protein n=1 Tax=Leptospira vanthielii serovar Holland str. Waz Holland = ATCC 700522 TaxID=1218591 RepID=N1W2X8_9LEPT|nr:hypothetical protein LEP1GSC199_1084 [Leptospira vanthielii serovar Holland str. Waz Holland = ATCC 700522]